MDSLQILQQGNAVLIRDMREISVGRDALRIVMGKAVLDDQDDVIASYFCSTNVTTFKLWTETIRQLGWDFTWAWYDSGCAIMLMPAGGPIVDAPVGASDWSAELAQHLAKLE